MSIQEMSNEFDVLFNNITSNQAPGLNEYEKSVFLTKAQNELVKNYFNPKGNKYSEGFDGNQKRQIDFSSIVRTLRLSYLPEKGKVDSRSLVYKFPTSLLCVINESFVDPSGVRYSVLPLSFNDYQRVLMKPYAYPPKKCLWRLISEPVSGVTGYWESPVPASGPFAYTNATDKPIHVSMQFWKAAGNSRMPVIKETEHSIDISMEIMAGSDGAMVAYWQKYILAGDLPKYLRLEWPNFTGDDLPDAGAKVSFDVDTPGITNKVELVGRLGDISKSTLSIGKCVYMCRYVKKPKPIILEDLNVDDYTVSIEGITQATECELPEELHPEIVQRAVELAKVAFEQQNAENTIKVGERSE